MFVLVGGPPPFESSDAWSRPKLESWAETAVSFIERSIGPDATIRSAVLHVDERSPHIHVSVVPAGSDEKGPKLSAAMVQRRMAGLPDRGPEHGAVVLTHLQDRFYAEVSEPFELARKRPGAKRPRETPDRAKGLADRLADTQRQVQELQRRQRAITAAASRRRVSERRSRCRVKAQERTQTATRATRGTKGER